MRKLATAAGKIQRLSTRFKSAALAKHPFAA
jgi:hypothetical protein